jgi:pimeloyl-ACP methyl ester carboxylesterase
MHPNLRGHPPSDNGDNLFRVGMAVDVLNLIALIKSQAGPAELFAKADSEAIGLWGHSLGGNIALRVLTIVPDIKATVLYASMSGDERKNAEWFFNASSDPLVRRSWKFPDIAAFLPPIITATSLRPSSSIMAQPIGRFPLPGQKRHVTVLRLQVCRWSASIIRMEDHTFRSRIADQFYGNMIGFYDKYLSP